MSINRILAAIVICGVAVLAPCSLSAQSGSLAKAKTIRCTFPVMSAGSWGKDKPEVQQKPPTQREPMVFEGINVDEGTAELKSNYGKYDIIVRYSNGYLHFIQSFLDGYLYDRSREENRQWQAEGYALAPRIHGRFSAGVHIQPGTIHWGMRDPELRQKDVDRNAAVRK